MKLLYLTAEMPFDLHEQFSEPEVRRLASQTEVVIIPTRPPGKTNRCPDLGDVTVHYLALFDGRVARLAIKEIARSPLAVASAFARTFGRGSSVRSRLVNLAIFPKALAVAAEVRRLGIGHIHANWLTTPATVAYVASRLTGIPFSVTAHQHDIFAANLIRKKTRAARFVRVISKRNCLHLQRQLSANEAARCHVVHLGVDVPSEITERKRDVPAILCTARMCEWKGHRYLLRAFATLRERGIAFRCDFAGDGELRDQVRDLVLELGLENEVRLLGNVGHDRLVADLASGAYDLFALASTERPGEHEGIPVAAIEAMAAGIPVVATKTGSLDELIRNDGDGGFLVPQRDPDALVTALLPLLSDAALRRSVGARGRAFVTEWFASVRTTDRLLELILNPAKAEEHSLARP